VQGFSFLLAFNDGRLELARVGHQSGAISCELSEPGFLRRLASGRRDPLVRSCGLHKQVRPTVLDTTAGLGRDGVVLAAAGAQVTLVERSPVVAALLSDGLKRAISHLAFSDWLGSRTELLQQDAIDFMRRNSRGSRHDIVYLDPMYPHRNKTALPAKEMQVLRALLGIGADADLLLEVALGYARRRVVVKRPPWTPPLGDRKPHHQINAKLVRYDVYEANACFSPASSASPGSA
jgi:16S rRNA (guanine1516-N2)-methyltransferase